MSQDHAGQKSADFFSLRTERKDCMMKQELERNQCAFLFSLFFFSQFILAATSDQGSGHMQGSEERFSAGFFSLSLSLSGVFFRHAGEISPVIGEFQGLFQPINAPSNMSRS